MGNKGAIAKGFHWKLPGKAVLARRAPVDGQIALSVQQKHKKLIFVLQVRKRSRNMKK